MKKVWLLLTIISVFILVIGLRSPAQAGDEKITYGYLVADQIHNFASMLMKEKKFLEDEGIKVKWGEFLAGAYLMQHLASGEVDFGTCGCIPTMITRGRGVDVVILAGSNTEGSSLVVKKSIKTVKDLDGKKIGTPGIGSIQDAMIDIIARRNNIKIYHKHMKVSDMPVFFKKGEIDGFIAWSPHPSRCVYSMGYGHILLTSRDILAGHQCCVLVARGELLRKKPDLVRKVIKAYIRAFDYERASKENHEETMDLLVKYTDTERSIVEKAWELTPHPYPPYVSIDSLKMQAEGLLKGGKLQKRLVPDLDKFIAQLYRPEFLMEYFRNR